MALTRWLVRLGVLGALATTWLLAGVYLYLSPDLPDVEIRAAQLSGSAVDCADRLCELARALRELKRG